MDLSLHGRRAVVCGSTQGIGKAIALEMALLGASVTLVARNEEKLRSVLKELDRKLDQHHEYIVADFGYPDDLKQKITRYTENNVVDILVNNTGGPPGGRVMDAHPDEFTNAFSNHLVCNHIMMQACMPGMKQQKYGRIINVISTSVKVPMPGLGVSSTIRGAVASWAKTLATELGPFGITVNNLLPGAIMTARLLDLARTRARESGKSESEVMAAMIGVIPAGRIGEPAEIAAAAAFLATPAAGYINGINLPVDGGRTPTL